MHSTAYHFSGFIVPLCIFMSNSELFKSKLASLHTFTLKYFNEYFLRKKKKNLISDLQKFMEKTYSKETMHRFQKNVCNRINLSQFHFH